MYATDVADVELRFALASPSQRGVNLYVPLADWGLRAQVVDAPVQILAEPRRINRRGVVALVAGSGEVRALRGQIDDAIGDALRRWALLALVGGLLGGFVALLGWHVLGVRGRALALAPAGGLATAVVAVGGLLAWSAISYDASALERPSYFASGAELERIVDQADALRSSGNKYSDRVDSAVRSIAGLLDRQGSGVADMGVDPATIRVALASDVHNNLLTLDTLRSYSEGRMTVLAGDFTVNGGRMETPLVSRMAAVGEPVVAVSGNHDSPGVMRTLAKGGVTVLEHDDGVQEIGGLSMAGFEDPLAYDEGDFPPGIRAGISFGDIEDGDELFADAVDERWEWWQDLPRRPQVLVVHQSAIGTGAGRADRRGRPGRPAVDDPRRPHPSPADRSLWRGDRRGRRLDRRGRFVRPRHAGRRARAAGLHHRRAARRDRADLEQPGDVRRPRTAGRDRDAGLRRRARRLPRRRGRFLESAAVDLFTLIVTATMVLGFLFILALGVWHPKTGAQILDWKPTRSAELEAQNDIDDVEQMIAAQNRMREKRGAGARSQDEVEAQVRQTSRCSPTTPTPTGPTSASSASPSSMPRAR